MIFCNLKRILKSMDMSVLKLSELTGIARLTITNLCNNVSGGIQFDTLDNILSIVNVDMDMLFTKYHFNYHIQQEETPMLVFTFDKQSILYDIKINSNDYSTTVNLCFNCENPVKPLSQNKYVIRDLNLDVIEHIQKDIANQLNLNNTIFSWSHQKTH